MGGARKGRDWRRRRRLTRAVTRAVPVRCRARDGDTAGTGPELPHIFVICIKGGRREETKVSSSFSKPHARAAHRGQQVRNAHPPGCLQPPQPAHDPRHGPVAVNDQLRPKEANLAQSPIYTQIVSTASLPLPPARTKAFKCLRVQCIGCICYTCRIRCLHTPSHTRLHAQARGCRPPLHHQPCASPSPPPPTMKPS